MTLVRRVLVSALGACALLFASTAPAAASPPNPTDPGAVTATAFVSGKTITVRLTNNHYAPLNVCGAFQYLAPNVPHRGTAANAWGPVDIQPGETREWTSTSFPTYNGNYQVYWSCQSVENGLEVWWGTDSPFAPTDPTWTPTAAPTPFVVDSPSCLGPICLPTVLGF